MRKRGMERKTEKEGKGEKDEKVEVKKNWLRLLIPRKGMGGSHQDGNQRAIDHKTGMIILGEPISSKAGRASKTAGSFQIHSHKTRITRP